MHQKKNFYRFRHYCQNFGTADLKFFRSKLNRKDQIEAEISELETIIGQLWLDYKWKNAQKIVKNCDTQLDLS